MYRWCKKINKGNVTLVSHNGNKFDFPILEACAKRAGVELPERIRTMDSIDLCEQWYGRLFGGRDRSLKTIKRCLQLGQTVTHDALQDCRDMESVQFLFLFFFFAKVLMNFTEKTIHLCFVILIQVLKAFAKEEKKDVKDILLDFRGKPISVHILM